jgi:transcription antitermination factor NusG
MGKLKIGDKAIVKTREITMGGFEVGDEVTIAGLSHASNDRFRITKGDHVGYCDPSSLEPVPAKLKVGDKVKLIGGAWLGKEGTVTSVSAEGLVFVDDRGEKFWAYQKNAKAIEPKPRHTFKVGDRVEVKGGLYEGLATVDEIDTIGCMLNTDRPHNGGLPCGRLWKSAHNLTLVKQTKFNVGDRIKMIDGSWVGKEGTVTSVGFTGRGLISESDGLTFKTDTGTELWAFQKNAKVIEQPKVKVGDKARVTAMSAPMCGFSIGDIVTVTAEDDHSSYPLKIEKDNGLRGYTTADKLELVEEETKTDEPKTEAVKVETITHVRAIRDGLDITEGEVYEVVATLGEGKWKIIDDAGDNQSVNTTEVTPFVEPKPKQYVRMLEDDFVGDFEKGDILEVTGEDTFIDRVGDERNLGSFKHEFVSSNEKPTTKNDVVDYLKKLSAEEVIAIVKEAR